jgi:hypothetical protein
MKKLFILVLVASFNYISASVSYGAQYWAKRWRGNRRDYAFSLCSTVDGGYMIAGRTDSFRPGDYNYDVWLIKLNGDGHIMWQKIYQEGDARSIVQTIDGGYVVAGSTYSSLSAGMEDVWILKLTSEGDISWQKSYGKVYGDSASSIQQTDDDGDGEKDDGYIVAGASVSLLGPYYDFWVLKLNSNGDVIWQRTYGGSGYDKASSVCQVFDEIGAPNGYIVAGTTESFGQGMKDVLLLKINNNGEIEWQKAYGEIHNDDVAEAIQQTLDGGYVVAGSTLPPASNQRIWILKLTSEGDISWQKSYGQIYGDEFGAILQTTDEGYIIAGRGGGFTSSGIILKTDGNGDLSWGKRGIGGSIYSILQNTEEEYITAGIMGYGAYDIIVSKLDSNCELPNCGLIKNYSPSTSNTLATSVDCNVSINTPDITIGETDVIPEDTSAQPYVLCCYEADDDDCDGILNATDNCPEIQNGPMEGTCIAGARYKYGRLCMSDAECGIDGLCSKNQEDFFPPEGNNIGDACELCIADFECDEDVDSGDVTLFLDDFGRSFFNNPCTNENQCNGDFFCDGMVDSIDVTKLLEEFGRNPFNQPCPTCTPGEWCN